MASAFTKKFPKKEKAIRTDVSICDKNNKVIKTVVGLWDTGATTSSINVKIAEELGLVPIGKTKTSTANGICEVFTYYLNIMLPNNLPVNGLLVTGTNLGDTDMLVGMDVISMGQLSISSDDNITVASFVVPRLEMKDFIDDLKRMDRAAFKRIGRNDKCLCGSGKKYKDCCWDKHHR